MKKWFGSQPDPGRLDTSVGRGPLPTSRTSWTGPILVRKGKGVPVRRVPPLTRIQRGMAIASIAVLALILCFALLVGLRMWGTGR